MFYVLSSLNKRGQQIKTAVPVVVASIHDPQPISNSNKDKANIKENVCWEPNTNGGGVRATGFAHPFR